MPKYAMIHAVVKPLVGGILIGTSASLMLFLNGRIAGISGILNGFLSSPKGEVAWRGAFLSGLIAGGIVLFVVNPDAFSNVAERPVSVVLLAGFLVGFGTTMGGGCTSGHGVCGISRLSPRSIVATAVFILSGMLSVAAYRVLFD